MIRVPVGHKRPKLSQAVNDFSAAVDSESEPAPLGSLASESSVDGKDAPVVHDVVDGPLSTATAASASVSSTAPMGRSDEVGGLKTRISTALGGLLERALDNRMERGRGTGPEQPAHGRPQESTSAPTVAGRGLPRPIYDTELAKQVRQKLMGKPGAAELVQLRRTVDSLGWSDAYQYVCFYCGAWFEQQSTRNRHMGRAHRDEVACSDVAYCEVKREEPEADPSNASSSGDSQHGWCDAGHTSWMSESPGTHVGGDGDFFCTESKPMVEASPSSECSAGSFSRTVTAGAESAGAGSCPSEPGGTTAASSPGTSAWLSAGEDAPAAHVSQGRPTSPATTASGAPTAGVGHGDSPGGLKTHISTALGGLLDRALNSWLEKGGPAPLPSRDLPTRGPRQKAKSCYYGPTRRPRPMYNTELATQALQQLSEPPVPPEILWDGKRHPYVCHICENRFEKQTTLSLHVIRAHKHEWICSELKREASEVDPDEGTAEGTNYESEPAAAISLSSERPAGSSGWPVASGAELAGDGTCPHETGVAPSGATSAGHACPYCHDLLAGKDALAVHVLEKHPNSVETTTSAPTTAPPGCSDEVGRLKTQISTALGGLLHRALNNRPEQGLATGGPAHLTSPEQPSHGQQNKRASRRIAPSSSPGPAAGRPRRVFNTELANRVRQQLKEPRGMVVALPPETCDAKRRPYVCFFCELRFERNLSRNKHMGNVHRKEMNLSYWKQPEPKDDADDLSGDEDSDYDWREPSPTSWISGPPGTEIGHEGDFFCSDCGINFKTLEKVLTHRKVEHGWSEEGGGRDAVAATSITVKRRAIEALQELDTQRCQVGACGPPRSDRVLRSARRLASCAEERGRGACSLPAVETDPLASPEPQVEEVFDEEETPFLLQWEVPDGCDSARDPLSIEDESEVPADEPLPVFCEVQSIKEEVAEDPPELADCVKEDPDFDLEVDATDNSWAAPAGQELDSTRAATPTSGNLWISEFGSNGLATPNRFHCDSSHFDEDTLSADTTMSTDTATSPISQSGGSANSANNRSGGPTADSAANKGDEEQCSGGADSAGTANTRPPLSYGDLVAISHSPHSTDTLTADNLSVSEVGSTGRASPGASHCEASDFLASEQLTLAKEAATATSSRGDADGSGATTAGRGAIAPGTEQPPRVPNCPSSANTRPPFSYVALISMAILRSPNRRATFSEICTYIASQYPYFQSYQKGWKDSIRTTVSRYKCFVKVERPSRGRGGNYWELEPRYGEVFEKGISRLRCSGDGEWYAVPAAHPRQPTASQAAGGAPPSPVCSSTDTLTADNLSVSEVGSTGRASPVTSHCEASDFLASEQLTLAKEAATATSSRGDADGSGRVTAGCTASGEQRPRGANSTSSANTRPAFSYVALIAMAIAQSPNRMATPPQICAYVKSRFPYFWSHREDWQKAIRHKLWAKDYFIRVPREGGKSEGYYWTLDPRYEDMFGNRGFARRLRQRRGGVLGNPHQPGSSTGASPAPEASQAARGIAGGGGALAVPTSPDDTRSTKVSDGKYSAACEDINVENVAHDGLPVKQQKSTLSSSDATRGEDNGCSVSTADNHFPVFTCSSCLQGFSSKYSLVKHVFVHVDGVEPPEHVCRLCGQVFHTDFGLTAHLTRQHSVRAPTRARKDRSSPDKCRGEFSTKEDLALSVSTHEQREKSKLLSTSHAPTKPYKCNVCSKSFAFACYLKNRAVMDTGKKPQRCEVCGKLFARAYDLKVHLLVHSGLKSLKCDVCGKSFSTVEVLESHLLVHNRGKSNKCDQSYKCDLCSKVFATPDALKSHSVVHSVVESQKCDDCGKLFARVGKFELLLSVHSGVNSLACSVCGKLFKSALTLKRHMLGHS